MTNVQLIQTETVEMKIDDLSQPPESEPSAPQIVDTERLGARVRRDRKRSRNRAYDRTSLSVLFIVGGLLFVFVLSILIFAGSASFKLIDALFR